MPRLKENKLLTEYRRPAASVITDMFSNYMKSSVDLAEKLGLAAPTVRNKKHHCERMTLQDYITWCQALCIPADEAADTIALYMRKSERMQRK